MAERLAHRTGAHAARARREGRHRVAATLLVFGVAFVGAKIHAPGHAKGKAKPLARAEVVRARRQAQHRRRAAQIAPAVQPPPVATSTS